jgi:hypothetical protein
MFGAICAIGEALSPVTPQTRETLGQLKPSFEKLNETGTLVSDMVHIREIAVIPRRRSAAGQPAAFRLIACRCAMAPI